VCTYGLDLGSVDTASKHLLQVALTDVYAIQNVKVPAHLDFDIFLKDGKSESRLSLGRTLEGVFVARFCGAE
jgi:hypothetical protein